MVETDTSCLPPEKSEDWPQYVGLRDVGLCDSLACLHACNSVIWGWSRHLGAEKG